MAQGINPHKNRTKIHTKIVQVALQVAVQVIALAEVYTLETSNKYEISNL